MTSAIYTEFKWGSAGPANGESGAGLAQVVIGLVKGLEDVKTICDLGCGNGYLTGLLTGLGYDVTGIDASDSGINIARANFAGATFLQATIDSTLRERTGLEQFDLVVSSDVIEHLYRPADLIEAAASLVKPNGRILVGTPYHGYLKNLVLSLTGKMDSHFCVQDDGGHIKFFSVKTLSDLLTRHGFVDLKFSYYGRAPWLWKNMLCSARKGD